MKVPQAQSFDCISVEKTSFISIKFGNASKNVYEATVTAATRTISSDMDVRQKLPQPLFDVEAFDDFWKGAPDDGNSFLLLRIA